MSEITGSVFLLAIFCFVVGIILIIVGAMIKRKITQDRRCGKEAGKAVKVLSTVLIIIGFVGVCIGLICGFVLKLFLSL